MSFPGYYTLRLSRCICLLWPIWFRPRLQTSKFRWHHRRLSGSDDSLPGYSLMIQHDFVAAWVAAFCVTRRGFGNG